MTRRENASNDGWPDPRTREGIAREMLSAFVALVVETDGPRRLLAHIAPGHTASERVAAALGLTATDEFDRAGEQIWVMSNPT